MTTRTFLPTNALANAIHTGVVKFDGTHAFSLRLSSATSGQEAWDDATNIDELTEANGYAAKTITLGAAAVYDTNKSRVVGGGTDPEWTASGAGFTVTTLVVVDDDADYDGGTGFPCFYCELETPEPYAAGELYTLRVNGRPFGILQPSA